ncbi:MAG: hypothetical protein JW741_17775 [Sedimentisphaerales bacterium]|nr:hypothetical protein [Sedimentisphaerales bacterium]
MHDWALQDSNTSKKPQQKARIPKQGAAKSAANPAGSRPKEAPGEAPESRPADDSRAGSSDTGTPAGTPADQPCDAEPVGEHFAEAVAMLARLPLTDAERAEAIRRLLAGHDTTGEGG